MGCRLPKLRKAEERQSPGNIYSTLRRPQVETKVGVAYTYHFLDFLLGKEEVPVSSVLCLSSVRELPVQVRDLYAQGFVLVAVHPFVHPCGPRHAHIQRQLHRAVLVRETPSSEKSQVRWERQRLETDVCVAGHQAADPEVIQSYVKRIQDVAEQGVMFVGFLQQPGGGPCFLGHWEPEELSSLHSSPSPIHRNPFSANTSLIDPTEPRRTDREHDDLCFGPKQENTQDQKEPDFSPLKLICSSELEQKESSDTVRTFPLSQESLESTDQTSDGRKSVEGTVQRYPHQDLPDLKEPTENHFSHIETVSLSSDSWLSSPELDQNRDKRATTHNNNHIRLKSSEKDNVSSPPTQASMQLFALYNHTGELNTSLRFYSLRVPLRVQKEAGLVTEVDTNWLDHMTQHFTSGARLVDGFFHLRDDKDNSVSSIDSVFIFQSPEDEETTNASYDAIVVEQWTVVDGVVVKTDYIPLLQSLAPFGWRLMCVLPTPIVKTNSDGSLSTKQILFLQRPVLQRKRKDFKMLNLMGRSKAKKKSTGETQEERKERCPVMETEMDRLRSTSEEEEEEDKMVDDSRLGQKLSVQKGAEDEPQRHQKVFSLLSESRDSVRGAEMETNIDGISVPEPEKSVRWADVCQMEDAKVKERVRTEERIKQQLFSGVC